MTVCVPEELPTSVLSDSGRLERHLGVNGTRRPRFWVTTTHHRWQRSQLIGLRAGHPAYCAGGPVRLLDLAGMRQAAAVGAGIRFQHWSAVVAGTRPAEPWIQFAGRHLADPGRYPLPQAEADFGRQPRVLAVRMHNAAALPAARLALAELEVFQAGPSTYTNYHALWSVAADGLLTADGHQIRPASDHLTDRVTYLAQATDHLDSLDRTQRLLAVSL
jgi:hypothetical protein